MRNRIDRRTLLRRLGVAGVAGLAGCLGDGGDDDRRDGADSSERPSDDGDHGEVDSSERSPDRTVQEPTSYAFELYEKTAIAGEPVSDSESEGFVTANGDLYLKSLDNLGSDGDETRIYHVGGEGYAETMGLCTPIPSVEAGPSPYGAFASFVEFEAAMREITPDETTTLDGEAVDVYEFDHTDAPDGAKPAAGEPEWTMTMYLSQETGYLRKSEYESTDIDAVDESISRFHSFDEAFTIDVPEGCSSGQ